MNFKIYTPFTIYQSGKWKLTYSLCLLLFMCMSLIALETQAQQIPQKFLDEIESMKGSKEEGAISSDGLPADPNPFVSTLPPAARTNYRAWMQYRQQQAMKNVQEGKKKGKPGRNVQEGEPLPGQNDGVSDAIRISQLGSNPGKLERVFIDGFQGEKELMLNESVGTQAEDDGAIPLANATGLMLDDKVNTAATIGDDPFAFSVSDFDFYKVEAAAGTSILADVVTPLPVGNDLDPTLTIWSADGTLLAYNDDKSRTNRDSFLSFPVPEAGTYYVCVGGYGAFWPTDPFVSGSGDIGQGRFGGYSKGTYDISIALTQADKDYYVFNLQRGDIFGAAYLGEAGGALLSVRSKDDAELVSTPFYTNFSPSTSPLPSVGQTTLNYTVEKSGQYAIEVSAGLGSYRLELFASRPRLELETETKQVIYIDYSGGAVDLEPILGPLGTILGPVPRIANHTPFAAFLPNWGLSNTPEDVMRITGRILEEVQENLDTDFNSPPPNPNHDIVITDNLRLGMDNELGPDFDGTSFSKDGINYKVSTVEVSGTQRESGINTIGIAQSIDPGNFNLEEISLLLLDVLSRPATGTSANVNFRINDIVLAPGKTREDAVVTVLANIIAHEVGHYLGNWHVDGFSEEQSLMDEGPGGLFNLAGIGPSGVFGAEDAKDVDFSTDAYSARELFTGVENTKINTAYALSFIVEDDELIAVTDEELVAASTANISNVMLLSQSYPNTLNSVGVARIGFTVAEEGMAEMKLYDMSGNEVGTLYSGMARSGQVYQVRVDAGQLKLKPGMYVYQLQTRNGEERKKILVSK
jgi:hypothetical protein